MNGKELAVQHYPSGDQCVILRNSSVRNVPLAAVRQRVPVLQTQCFPFGSTSHIVMTLARHRAASCSGGANGPLYLISDKFVYLACC
jgi:hypothetical protein